MLAVRLLIALATVRVGVLARRVASYRQLLEGTGCESKEEFNECMNECRDNRDCNDTADLNCSKKCRKACKLVNEERTRCENVLISYISKWRGNIDWDEGEEPPEWRSRHRRYGGYDYGPSYDADYYYSDEFGNYHRGHGGGHHRHYHGGDDYIPSPPQPRQGPQTVIAQQQTNQYGPNISPHIGEAKPSVNVQVGGGNGNGVQATNKVKEVPKKIIHEAKPKIHRTLSRVKEPVEHVHNKVKPALHKIDHHAARIVNRVLDKVRDRPQSHHDSPVRQVLAPLRSSSHHDSSGSSSGGGGDTVVSNALGGLFG